MEQNRPRFLTRQIALDTVTVLLAAAAGLALASALVRTHVEVGPLTLSARIAWGWPGESSLRVPPFGDASARTHIGPARLVVTVESVDLPGVERLLTQVPIAPPAEKGAIPELRSTTASASELVSSVVAERSRTAGQDVAGLALLSSLVAASASALVALLARRRFRVVLAAGVLAFSLVVGSVAVAASSFRAGAIAEPRLEGALASVPRLASIFSSRVASIERLREQASEVARELAAYYANPRSIAAGGGLPDTFRVLHVSDLHLDPVGAELARSLVRSYETSLVIDTGDIAISGRRQEAALLGSLVVTSVPVVYVPGNHDSAVVVASLSAMPNVRVATTSSVSIDGLTIVPVPDPQYVSLDIEPDRRLVDKEVAQVVERLDDERRIGLPTPDIIALHNPRRDRDFIGLAPVVLSGHTHSGRLYVNDGTVRLNSGTLGGMPYDPRAIQRATLPHSASVLYYTQELPRRLIAVDRISVSSDRTTTMIRHVVDESLLTRTAAP